MEGPPRLIGCAGCHGHLAVQYFGLHRDCEHIIHIGGQKLSGINVLAIMTG